MYLKQIDKITQYTYNHVLEDKNPSNIGLDSSCVVVLESSILSAF